MWVSGWVLVPNDDVQRVVENKVEWLGFPSIGFNDGEVEGSDLNRLWMLMHAAPPAEPLWGRTLRDGWEKVACVREEAIEAFSELPDSRIRELAVAWQKAESQTSSLPWWELEDIADAIRGLKFLARQQPRTHWQLLMVWVC